MGYIISADYLKSIQTTQLTQITGGDNSIVLQAEGAAMERAIGMLRQKYDISSEFTNTQLYNINSTYKAADRVYINYPAYVAANSYVVGDYCTNGTSAYVCITNTTGTFNASHWSSIGTSTSIYYAAYPYPYFNLYGFYYKDDKVFYKGHIYKAKQQTSQLTNFAAVQFVMEDNVPEGNVFPDDRRNGAQWWEDLGAYSVASNLLATAAYSEGTSYAVNDYAQYGGDIFICITDTTGQFNPSDWQKVWALGDNRSQLMVTSIVDIALWYIHTRIAPNNIPELRVDKYNVAIEWLRRVRDGIEQANMPLIQPKEGRRILSDSRVARNNYY